MTTSFEPRIVASCCKYCAYATGDPAGSMRLSYPASIRITQVPCTGRVDMVHLLRAIEDGADGVYVAGCLEGECHFLTGNLKTRKSRIRPEDPFRNRRRPRARGDVQPLLGPGAAICRNRPGNDRTHPGTGSQPDGARQGRLKTERSGP